VANIQGVPYTGSISVLVREVRARENLMGLSQANVDALLADAEEAEVDAVCSVAPSPPARRTPDVQRILGLDVTLSVVLAERLITIESILNMTAGTIIEFDVPFDAELKLNIGNRTVGHGQTIKIGENFGLRLTNVATVPDRVEAMGHAPQP